MSPDGNTVLVGTGEPNNATDSYYGLGILRSTSAGAPGTWTLISGATSGQSFHGLGVSKIAFNTSNPAQVVAGISHTSVSEGADTGNQIGLFYSVNGGASWTLAERLSARLTGYWTETVNPITNFTLSVTPSLITRQRRNLGRLINFQRPDHFSRPAICLFWDPDPRMATSHRRDDRDLSCDDGQ